MRILGFLFLSLFVLVSAPAATISYTATGTFDADAPHTALSDPGMPFRLTFLLPEDPVPAASGTDFFTVHPTVAYFLNGVDTAHDDLWVIFWTESSAGLFDIGISAGTLDLTFSFWGAQIFTGAASAPTLITGSWDTISGSVTTFPDNMYYPFAGHVTAEAVPEPSTALLVIGSLTGLLALRRRFSAS